MWEMEVEEMEAVLEKIWDLHDKLSDAIHIISRSHFLNSIKSPLNNNSNNQPQKSISKSPSGAGFVFAKDFRPYCDTDDDAITEARSLNSIRSALENLEDQLEFFHTVQSQQRAERDAAIARLEQSRIVLAMCLADHHGKKYKVIEEALAFVGDVHDAGRFVKPGNPFETPKSHSGENLEGCEGKKPNILMQMLISSFNIAKKSFKLECMGGVLGNAALIAVSMLALLQLNQVALKSNFVLEVPQLREDSCYTKGSEENTYHLEDSSSGPVKQLDVLAARG